MKKIKKEFETLYTNSLKGIPPNFHLNPKTIETFNQERIITITDKFLRKATELIAVAVE